MDPKAFIDRIYFEKAKTDSNSQDLARALDVLSKTVFGDVNRFVFELLQNADDAPVKDNEGGIEVEFRLLDEYLVFSHNGSHFTEDDVVGISSVGSRMSKKDADIEKTGYKGIGFKSVFGTSDEVHIFSDKFTFRFDKNFDEWEEDVEYPWQVIPIWTDTVPDDTAGHVDIANVNTLIRVGDRNSVGKEIKAVFEDCQIMLFLRNVSKITFYDRARTVLVIEKVSDGETIELFKDGKSLSVWMLKDYIVPISEALNKKLNDLSDVECPRKLKDAKNTKITFAACIEENAIKAIPRALMYCYLPTKVTKGFPFLINGDFLTNAERTDFLPNIWNKFLFATIAVKQLEWLRELQGTAYKYQVMRLFRGKFSTTGISDIETEYNSSLTNATNSIAFLPEEGQNRLLKITEGIVDTYKFCSVFQPNIITDFLVTTNKVIDLRLGNQSILVDFGAKNFKFEQITKLISTGRTNNINDTTISTNVIIFLYNSTMEGKNPAWLIQLRDLAFIADEDNILKTPKEIFFPVENSTTDNFDLSSLSFINSKILDHCKQYPEVIEWLRALGVKEPTDIEIVRKSIFQLIETNAITEENAVPILKFVFKVFASGLLNDKDYTTIANIKVSTANGLKSPQESYLPDEFDPDQKLSQILVGANFISLDYKDETSTFSDWKVLLKRIGVRDNLSIQTISEKIERTTFIAQYPYSKSYFEWLDTNEYYPALYSPYRNSGQHYISNFTHVEFRKYLKEYAFSKMFWKQMLVNWDAFKIKCDQTTYHYYRGSNNIVPCYIQYFVKKFETIPCTDGKMYPSTEVYSSNLKSVVNGFYPVADFEGHLLKDQVAFFGFKKEISFTECLSILGSLDKLPINAELNRQISSLYDEIISKSREIGPAELKILEQWKLTGKLLAQNNTFQPVSNLYCFSPGISAPVNSHLFIKIPSNISGSEIEALCEVFDIPFITFDKLQFTPINPVVEKNLKQALLSKIKYIALIHAHSTSGDYEKILESLFGSLSTIEFKQADKLSLIYFSESQDEIYNYKIEAWNDNTGFYFTGKWTSPLTMYHICTQLCLLLNFKNSERELALILQLEEKDIYTWLSEKGYSVEHLSTQKYVTSSSAVEIEEVEAADEIDELPVQFETFTPTVQASEIEYSNIQPITKSIGNSTIKTTVKYAELSTSEAKINVGRWSEEFVFRYLQQNSAVFTKIEWVNEKGESGLPYDFKVLENNIPLTIEVKGTPSKEKNVATFPLSEWKIMFEQGHHYSIFRVYNAGSESASLERIDNPSTLIEKGFLITDPIELHL